MNNDLYWISAITYAVIIGIIIIGDLRMKYKANEVERSFRLVVFWVLGYFLQDAFWGLCASGIIRNDTIFFISSSIFHIATVATTICWLNYVLRFMGEEGLKRKILLGINGLIILGETVLVIINCFTPTLFRIEDGVYVTEYLRPLTFSLQYLVYVTIAIVTLVNLITANATKRRGYATVFAFTLAPVALGILQLMYPDGPFYSLGFFLGCFTMHILVVARERAEATRNSVLHSIAETFYSMHCIDLDDNTIEILIQSDILTQILDGETRADVMVKKAFAGTVCDEYSEIMQEFTDISTLPERMGDKSMVSCEFLGKFHGWTRASFIPVERDESGRLKKVMLTTQIIDAEKKNQIELLFKSNSDELTGLYNRRAYENDLMVLADQPIDDDLVLISMDVNELKIVNDTLGHMAGDELLVGAATCMKKAFGLYGKIYRTGGDEFNAIIRTDAHRLDHILRKFDRTLLEWSGKYVSSVSVSYGCVARSDLKLATLHKMTILADERMYEAKTAYYRTKGVDRRGQHDAHAALCALYTKILKVNITDDTYQVVNMDENEQTKEMGFSDKISTWLAEFGKSGQVHPEDLENYLALTDLAYMREYFTRQKTSLVVFYRRKIHDEYQQAMMEIIPANDYSDENQNLYLYVKSINR